MEKMCIPKKKEKIAEIQRYEKGKKVYPSNNEHDYIADGEYKFVLLTKDLLF